MQDARPMQLNDSYYSVCANALIKATQRMTLREMQLIQIAISQIVKTDTELYTYTTTISELARFLNVAKQNVYRDYESIVNSLLRNVVTIEIDNTTKKFQWLSYAEYNKNNHTITIRLHDQLKPFLIGLNKLYTQIDINSILQFKSYYALRLYQFILMEYGYNSKKRFEMSLDEVRKFFAIPDDKYNRPYDLLKRTLKLSIDELNSTDLCTIENYQIIKQGKSLVGARFNVIW